MERINAAGVPTTPIYNIGESLDSDIVHALGMIAPIEHPIIRALNLIGPPLSIGGGKGEWLRRPPPLLGEHTAEVMREVGYSSETIAVLAESGVVFDPSITPDSDLAHSATPHGAP